MDQIIERLSMLNGSWKGTGEGKFPTINSFKYEEHLRFEVNLAYPLIHYEQKTILLSTQEPSHWESGFIRVLDEDVIEISNSQDSGRVEVLRGKISQISEEGYQLEFTSIVLANDPRMVKASRVIKVTSNALECHQSMTTNTTNKSIMLPHLHSILTRLE